MLQIPFTKNYFIKRIFASSHKPERRKLLTSRVLIIWKPAKTFVAVSIPKNDKPGPCEDPEPRTPWGLQTQSSIEKTQIPLRGPRLQESMRTQGSIERSQNPGSHEDQDTESYREDPEAFERTQPQESTRIQGPI